MANSTIPNLVAVAVPAGTDLFGVRQSGDTRDKKLTATQLLSQAGNVFKVGTPANNQLGVWTGDGTIEGTNSIAFDGSTFTMNLGGGDLRLTGKLELQGSNRPAVLDESASNTNPTFAPLGNSPTSGLGGQGSSVSLIAFSKPAIEVTSLNAKILQAYETDRTVTAFAGGGQGSATILDSSFNILTTVASPADSVKLPALFQGNDPCTVVYIKNDGANAADVFPATGDDLGAGVNTAVSVAAGESVSFIATLGSSTWTPFIVDTKGSGGAQISGTPANNQLGVWVNSTDIEGDANWQIIGTLLRGSLGNGPGMVNINGINILPRHGDPNTGLQNVGDDRLAMVAGGVAGLTLIEASSAVLPTYQTNVGITAFATGGQTSATELRSGYNVVDTVATTGDSVKFTSLVNVGSLVYLKNNGANALDLFPAGGDDLGLGVGVAISVPAGKSVAFLGSVLSSTWTQLMFEDGVSFPILAPDGLESAPSYSFASDPDSGIFSVGANQVGVSLAGSVRFFASTPFFAGASTTAGGIVDEATGATNPTLVPSRSDLDTGVGSNGADTLSLIAGGDEIARLQEVPGANQLILTPLLIDNNPAAPTLAFGDGDTGIMEVADDSLRIVLGGVERWTFSGDALVGFIGNGPRLQNEGSTATNPTMIPALGDVSTGMGGVTTNLSLIVGGAERIHLDTSLSIGNIFTGDWAAANAAGPVILDEAASATNPTLVPDRGDQDTGLGHTAALDGLSFVTGGVEALSLVESGGGITVTVKGPTTFEGNVLMQSATGASLQNTSATATVPTVVPNQADINTGLGSAAADQLSLIAGGLEGIRVAEAASVITNTIFGRLIANAAGGPALQNEAATFNNPSILPNKTDDDTGIGIGGSDVLSLIAGASERVRLTSGDGLFRGNWNASTSTGPSLLNEAASATNPTLVPNQADDNTGIGSAAADQLDLIAGGLSCMAVRETAAARQIGFYTTAPISQQTGVAVSSAGIHAALVALGLITA